MSYWLDCACGNRVEVTAAQAGRKAACACGKQVDVPRLSVLRRLEGSGAEQVSPELVVTGLYADGSRPVGGDHRLRCGIETNDRIQCVVECERPWVRHQDRSGV